MKTRIFFISALLLVGCSSNKDQAFCDCLDATEKLNNFSEPFMTKHPTEEEQTKLKDLQKKKDEACSEYETLDGETARQKKEACEE